MNAIALLTLVLSLTSAKAQTGGGANGGSGAEPAWDGAVAILTTFMGDDLIGALGVADRPEVQAAIAGSKLVTATTLTAELKSLMARIPLPEFTDQELEIPGRTCVNHIGGGIVCHRGRYAQEKMNGIHVETTLHEYLGALGVETNTGTVSNYPIAKYAANFVSLESRQVQVMRKRQPIPTQSSVTYRHQLIDVLQLKPLAKKYNHEEALNFIQANEEGDRIIVTCAVTMESLFRSQNSNVARTQRLLKKLPTGFAIVFGRHVSVSLDPQYSGEITMKPGGKTTPSLRFALLWDLFAQKMGTPQFYSNGSSHTLGGCVQPAAFVGDDIALGWSKRGERATLSTSPETPADEPALWKLDHVGSNLKRNLFCGYDEVLRKYQDLNLELVCAYGAYTD